MAEYSAITDHKSWLGYLQPEGLVVSPAALVDAQVILDRNAIELQQQLLQHVYEADDGDDTVDVIADFPLFAYEFLDWPEECILGLSADRDIPDGLVVHLPEIEEVLRPTYAFIDDREPDSPPILLVQILTPNVKLDAVTTGSQAGWSASASQRFERLLRETQIPIGILCNGRDLRLLYAPRGETAGSLTFPITHLTAVPGRPLVAALHMLLSRVRLLSAPNPARLHALLTKSRDYQSQVSAALAGQVLDALYELLRGVQAANAHTKGELLRDVLNSDPDQIYAALLTVLMRLVFLLYSEDRGLMPGSSLYSQNYSVHGLFERLRTDAERFPDTMDQRYGAWPQLIALFRAVYAGSIFPEMSMPAREGHLFDPERYPFLEGHALSPPKLPLISDGCLERVLNRLLILAGERLSYRTLDVEEIGSVYQTIMGFGLQVVSGTSIAIAGKRKHKSEVAAPVVIDLQDVLSKPGTDRTKWLKAATGHDWEGAQAELIKAASTVDEILIALDKRIARHATPYPVAPGGLVLQPTDERRRTGSHYTPRKLTEPIVRKTLEPILAQLGENPTPDQILDLKVCDPAMGSGAFLVETCRQLADALVESWARHKSAPPIPPDEDELLLARRLVAQRCLYGVDKNPMAVDLAKLSLWLATLARDHPFTFLDHSLRSGDSLVGLTRQQIVGFTWGTPDGQLAIGQGEIDRRIKLAADARLEILHGGDSMTPEAKKHKLALADSAASRVRLYGDLVVAAFFGAAKPKDRAVLQTSYLDDVLELLKNEDGPALLRLTHAQQSLQLGDHPVTPFHWEIEFPEVFGRKLSGFDAIVGNPPFAGKNTLINSSRDGLVDWLKELHAESHGNADLVAHFFRRAFNLLKSDGCFGLIATNTIGQGDTRSTGLRWICTHGGMIYNARQRYKWPGQAAVVVSVVHVARGASPGPYELDGRSVDKITAYLFQYGSNDNPVGLNANNNKCFQGVIVLGPGFTFDDADTKGLANRVSLMNKLIASDPDSASVIYPYVGGEEVNTSPTQSHHRYIINFGEMTEEQARKWPELISIVVAKVMPERLAQKDQGGKDKWWQFLRPRPEMNAAISQLRKVLVRSITSKHRASATFISTNQVLDQTLVVTAFDTPASFAVLVSGPHLVWADFFGASLEERPRYNVTDCFETFPFPLEWEANTELDPTGRACFDFRTDLMGIHNEGLTKTYNRFHDPDELDPDIITLRELHSQMDRAVLDAYGWQDIPTKCDFFLEYEDDADEEDSRARKRKKPWRYRWPDEVRDEVLARLLELNAKRAEEERLAGLAAAPAAKTRMRRAKPTQNESLGL